MNRTDLIRQYIETDPQRPGVGEARLVRYGTPVWALIGYYKVVRGIEATVAQDYGVPVEAVEAALAYYEEHQAELDARLSENAA